MGLRKQLIASGQCTYSDLDPAFVSLRSRFLTDLADVRVLEEPFVAVFGDNDDVGVPTLEARVDDKGGDTMAPATTPDRKSVV